MIGAVDIGGTKIAVGIVDPEGKLLSRFESATQADGPYECALDRTATMLRAAMASTGANLQGIGSGSTGPVYPFTGEIVDVNFYPHWRGQNPAKDLEKIFGVPVAMENEADAAALGEAGWGSGRNKSRLIYVTVGTGIGAGIILEGHVYRGVDQAHPEVGHHVIDASGPLCTCGFRGCWEALATGPAMAEWFQSKVLAGRRTAGDLTAKEIFRLAKEGDGLAQEAVTREAYYLGLGLANLINLFVPEVIVLGGSVMKSVSLDELRKVISQGCRFVPFEQTELALASLREDANLIGAARVWHHRFGQQASHAV